VQHKQTRELYALKYINKAKCVKMKAVANIIQERRLLEEVCYPPKFSHIACLIDPDCFHFFFRSIMPSL